MAASWDGSRDLYCGSVTEQLNALNREEEEMPKNSNSFFESVARQADVSVQLLRRRAAERGLGDCHLYMTSELTEKQKQSWLEEVRKLENDYYWNSKMQYQFMAMTHDVIDRKIVIIRNHLPPLVFSEDGRPLDQNTIILTHNSTTNVYNSTRPKAVDAAQVACPEDTAWRTQPGGTQDNLDDANPKSQPFATVRRAPPVRRTDIQGLPPLQSTICNSTSPPEQDSFEDDDVERQLLDGTNPRRQKKSPCSLL